MGIGKCNKNFGASIRNREKSQLWRHVVRK